MSVLKTILSDDAKSDLIDIATYTLGNWGHFQSQKYTSRIIEKIGQISKNPEIGEKLEKYRYISCEKHWIFYFIDRQQIVVARILHERSDWIVALNRKK